MQVSQWRKADIDRARVTLHMQPGIRIDHIAIQLVLGDVCDLRSMPYWKFVCRRRRAARRMHMCDWLLFCEWRCYSVCGNFVALYILHCGKLVCGGLRVSHGMHLRCRILLGSRDCVILQRNYCILHSLRRWPIMCRCWRSSCGVHVHGRSRVDLSDVERL